MKMSTEHVAKKLPQYIDKANKRFHQHPYYYYDNYYYHHHHGDGRPFFQSIVIIDFQSYPDMLYCVVVLYAISTYSNNSKSEL